MTTWKTILEISNSKGLQWRPVIGNTLVQEWNLMMMFLMMVIMFIMMMMFIIIMMFIMMMMFIIIIMFFYDGDGYYDYDVFDDDNDVYIGDDILMIAELHAYFIHIHACIFFELGRTSISWWSGSERDMTVSRPEMDIVQEEQEIWEISNIPLTPKTRYHVHFFMKELVALAYA